MGIWEVGAGRTKTIEGSSFWSHSPENIKNFITFLRPGGPPSSPSFSLRFCLNRNALFSLLHKRVILPTGFFTIIPNAYPVLYLGLRYFCSVVQLFEELPYRDRYVQDAQFHRVHDVIKSSTMRPNIVTATVAHCLAFQIGALAHLPTSTSLITIYSKAGDFGSSRNLFEEIHYRDVILWNSIIAASVENRCFGTAMNFFVKMIKEETGFDSTTLLLIMSASSYMKHVKQGRAIHNLSVKTGMLSDVSLCNALTDMYAKCSDLSSSECVFVEMECKDVVSWNSIMSGCLYNSHPERSLRYFKEMAFSGEQADCVSLSCAITASSCLGELVTGQAIHTLRIKLGYNSSSHVSVGNSLISLYSECGDIEPAETVFREMIHKDVISWNAMMEGFESNGKVYEVLELLFEMQLVGDIQPDIVTIVTVIKVCAEMMMLREGKTVHGFAIRKQMGDELSFVNSLINMYSKCNSVKKAEILFNSSIERDLVSWNTMISGYSLNRYYKEAQLLFKELLHWCSVCSLSTSFAVLSSCSSPKSLHFGKSIHCWQLKLGFSDHILLVNSLMYMYINCGELTGAFSLLQEISTLDNVDCWNSVIVGCMRNDHFQEALETFNFMREGPCFSYDIITFVSVLSACGNLELLPKGKSIHGLALKSSLGSHIRVQNSLVTMYGRCGDIESARSVFNFSSNRNLCSWNCLISALSQNKESREAMKLFRCLLFEPNEITLVSILSACTQIGVLGHGKQIHGHVFRSGFQDNSFISAALLDMYSNCGRLDIAIQIFRHSTDKSVAAWNSMISAYAYHGNGRKAIETFNEMCKSGTTATKSTFISLLSACSHSGLVSEGLQYYNYMFDKYGVQPTTEHQVCVVDMLGRSGKLNEAYAFTKGLHPHPNSGVWGALLSACNYHGEIELGRKIAELLFQLEPENAGYYISLSNMYVAAGSWKDAVELRTLVEDQGLKKRAGYSLIDVGLG
ncbi:Pentatricopeptide repeat-containing protein [Quillaja saponaria]|uniref:Pentatricopeptide repeat-containing protein n=1 Tax=Quillaja saponaria TaxID=32244 RepID=A0AAD7KS78_QUISA|nr:Pentatricopeptide repeat-containing protein [Quillaja saponaria]